MRRTTSRIRKGAFAAAVAAALVFGAATVPARASAATAAGCPPGQTACTTSEFCMTLCQSQGADRGACMSNGCCLCARDEP